MAKNKRTVYSLRVFVYMLYFSNTTRNKHMRNEWKMSGIEGWQSCRGFCTILAISVIILLRKTLDVRHSTCNTVNSLQEYCDFWWAKHIHLRGIIFCFSAVLSLVWVSPNSVTRFKREAYNIYFLISSVLYADHFDHFNESIIKKRKKYSHIQDSFE